MFQSSLRATAKLHLLSPAVFPLPFGVSLPQPPKPSPLTHASAAESAGLAEPAEPAETAEPAVHAVPHVACQAPSKLASKAGTLQDTAAAAASAKAAAARWPQGTSASSSKVCLAGPVTHLTSKGGRGLHSVELDGDGKTRTPGIKPPAGAWHPKCCQSPSAVAIAVTQ